MNTIALLRKFLAGAAVAASLLVPAMTAADDTDLYVDNDRDLPPSSKPLVMFSLDYRANLTSSGDAASEQYFRDAGMGADVDALKAIGGGKWTFFDILILSLKLVLQDVRGIKIGFMFNHNDAGSTTGTPLVRKCKGANLVNADCISNGETGASKDCDGDSIRNDIDFCPTIPDASNSNSDLDNCGAVCDNCPGVPNSDQADGDNDGVGDACDSSPEGAGSPGFSSTPTGSNGGVVLMGFQDIDSVGTLNAFLDKLIALKKLKPTSSSPDHPYQGAELFYEFFRYLTGQGIYNGHNGVFDFESGSSKNAATNMRCNDPDSMLAKACWDTAIESGSRYLSPLAGIDGCAKIFTVNFMFQVSQQEADATIFSTPKASGGLGIPTPSTQNDFFPAVLSFLHGTDLADGTFGTAPDLAGKQSVTSFFLVDPTKINTTTNAYAAGGGTGAPLPLEGDPAKLVATLRNVFQQILSVSTTLVAASVPVNVFNRSEIVDNVYFALFQAQGAQAESNVTPGGPSYWPGNLKKLRLEPRDVTDAGGNVVGRRITIVDARGQLAINSTDGRIALDALTLWTDDRDALLNIGDINGDGIVDAKDGTDPDTVADNTLPPAPATGNPANLLGLTSDRDGRYIPRGGAGQRVPGFTAGTPGDSSPAAGTDTDADGPRKVLYLTRTSGASLTSLDVADRSSSELKTDFGNAALTDTAAERLIRYARGQDVNDEDADGNTTEHRFWLLGDPLHSRPLPLNYGMIEGHSQAANPAIFVAMAANDGALRMFRNTAGGAPGTTPATGQLGQEMWAFYPPEGLAVQQQLMENCGSPNPAVTPCTQTVPLHPYSFDGEPTALVIDQDGDGNVESGDRVILYIGLRRGGSGTSSATIASAYYALDVTDPMEPVFLWRITPTSRTTPAGVTATTDFAEMGYTFSRPRVGTVQDGANRRLAVFFGGGYDGGYTGALDADSRAERFGNDVDAAMANDSRGRAIYVVRANNAALLWKAVAGASTSSETSNRTFVHADLKDSIASNLTIVDTDADSVIDRIVVGDLGGNVWRADLGGDSDNDGNNVDNWKLTRVACLGRHSGAGCATISSQADDRRFFHEPDVVQARDDNGTRYDAIVIGSGDRENPLDQGPMIDVTVDGVTKRKISTIDVDNYLYVIRDYNVGVGAGVNTERRHSDLTPINDTCLPSTACVIDAGGWKLFLDHAPNGEKALSAPLTIANTVFFTTYLPAPPADPNAAVTSCGPKEGGGFLYAVKLANGAPRYNYDTSGGGQMTDEGTTAEDRSVDLNTQGIPAQVVYLGSPGGSNAEGCTVNVLAGARIFEAPGCPRFRTFWQRVGS